MTTEHINRAICAAIGKQYHKPTEAEIASGSYYQYEPDFTRDLNAMNEAEKVLDVQHRGDYSGWLINLSGTFGCIFATAAQRAEAFLRTIGKWDENQ